MPCPLLDDLFAWAAAQPPLNNTFVNATVVTNTAKWDGGDWNAATYAAPSLRYQPGRWFHDGIIWFYHPPTFASSGTEQYLSVNTYPGSGLVPAPFNPGPDTLRISITAPSLNFPQSDTYSVHLQSPKVDGGFAAMCDGDAGIHGLLDDGVTLVTICLCNRFSEPIPTVQDS